MWSFLVPSRISALARPGGVAGQTRPTVVWANHGSTTAYRAGLCGDWLPRWRCPEAQPDLRD
jgi:hypothetical protein